MPNSFTITKEVDAKGLQCPGLILETYRVITSIVDGEFIAVESSDFGYYNDIQNWCEKTGNTLVDIQREKTYVRAVIQKGKGNDFIAEEKAKEKNATIVLFSGEYDKAMAAMIIAIGAASMGQKVSVFCTFWGLNALKKDVVNEKVEKSRIESMFGSMLPSNAEKMPLSSMNIGGLGKSMMMKVMKDKNVDSLSELMEQARSLHVKFIACTMSMDVMGIKEAELRDDVVYGGVASYIADSEDAGLTLFI